MKITMSPRKVAAYAAVYLFWGGSFLAIRNVVHIVPPFFAAAMRYAISGPILLFLSFYVRREARPTRRQVMNCLMTGVITFSLGYSVVFWAETRLTSWLVAVLTATTFLWTYLGECFLLRTERVSQKMLLPLLLGLAGMPLLCGASFHQGKMWSLLAILAVLLGAVTSAGGVLLIKRLEMPSSFLQTAGFQLVFAGLTLLMFSGSLGELKRLPPVTQMISSRFLGGMAYLICCGSIIAFTSFQWLLKHDKATLAATTTYANPIVAMVVGIVFAHEQRTVLQLLGAFGLLGSVVAVWYVQANFSSKKAASYEQSFEADLQAPA